MRIRAAYGLAVWLLCTLVLSCTQRLAGGTDTGHGHEDEVVGTLYGQCGTLPAVGAKVSMRSASSLADTSGVSSADVASVKSDSEGRYGIDGVDTGLYVIEATDSANNRVFIQGVHVASKDSTKALGPDTLEPAGAIRGKIVLSEGGDPRKVLLLSYGIDRFTRVNADGSFLFTDLARGTYTLRILPLLADYGVLDTGGIAVKSSITTDIDSIVLPFTGIPLPKNVAISYDTLKQIVTLTWTKADTALVKSYNVYRRNVDSNTMAVRINASPVTDTVYRDSTGIQDQTYEYRVAAVSKSATEGTQSGAVSVTAVSAFTFIRNFGQQGTSPGEYNSPNGISISNQEIVSIADYDLGAILTYDTNGIFRKNYGGFNAPSYVVSSKGGKFYVVEKSTHLIKLVDSTGAVLSQFGGGGTQDGQFSDISPGSFVIGQDGRLYVPDYGGNRVQIFDSVGTYLRELSISSPWSISLISDSKLAIGSDTTVSILDTNGTLKSIYYGIHASTFALTKNGNLIVAAIKQDGFLCVQKIALYSPQGKPLAIFGNSDQYSPSDFSELSGIAVDGNNNFYVVDNGKKQVKKFRIPLGL
jgi:hypothetical protein